MLIKFVKFLLDKAYPNYEKHSYLPPDLLILCVSYNAEVRIKYYPNGQIEEIVRLYNEWFCGTCEYFWDNGNPKFIENYWEGERDGVNKAWYENGNRWWIHHYKNDVDHGFEQGWNKDGSEKYANYYYDGRYATKDKYNKLIQLESQ